MTPRESSEESPSAGRQGSNPIFSASCTPPCLLVDMPVSLHWTIIFLVKPLPASVLRPRRHSEQQHLFQAPHTIGQARSHRRGARPPLFGRAAAVGGLGLRQGLAYARVGQAEIVVTMEHGQLLPHAVLALAEGADPSSHGCHMLADGEVDPLNECCVALPAARRASAFRLS